MKSKRATFTDIQIGNEWKNEIYRSNISLNNSHEVIKLYTVYVTTIKKISFVVIGKMNEISDKITRT